jgi:hypothetical protein
MDGIMMKTVNRKGFLIAEAGEAVSKLLRHTSFPPFTTSLSLSSLNIPRKNE